MNNSFSLKLCIEPPFLDLSVFPPPPPPWSFALVLSNGGPFLLSFVHSIFHRFK